MALIHDPAEDTHGADWPARFAEAMEGAAPALTRLRERGGDPRLGPGREQRRALPPALERADPDLFLIAGRYSLLDQGALAALLPACAARGAGLIIGGPYNSGLLAGGSTFDYAPAPAALLARRDRIAGVCAAHGVHDAGRRPSVLRRAGRGGLRRAGSPLRRRGDGERPR